MESRQKFEPADKLTPERQFEREWAMTLLDRVIEQLQGEFVAAGKKDDFEALKPTLSGDAAKGTYGAISHRLNCSANAARQAARRLKIRYRELLRDEVAQTPALRR